MSKIDRTASHNQPVDTKFFSRREFLRDAGIIGSALALGLIGYEVLNSDLSQKEMVQMDLNLVGYQLLTIYQYLQNRSGSRRGVGTTIDLSHGLVIDDEPLQYHTKRIVHPSNPITDYYHVLGFYKLDPIPGENKTRVTMIQADHDTESYNNRCNQIAVRTLTVRGAYGSSSDFKEVFLGDNFIKEESIRLGFRTDRKGSPEPFLYEEKVVAEYSNIKKQDITPKNLLDFNAALEKTLKQMLTPIF